MKMTATLQLLRRTEDRMVTPMMLVMTKATLYLMYLLMTGWVTLMTISNIIFPETSGPADISVPE